RRTELISYAPGYPILLAAGYQLFGHNYSNVQLAQSIVNSLTCVLLFFVSGELLGWRAAAVAGLLTSIVHSVAYYSIFVTPESLCPLPILLAFYVLARERLGSGRSFVPYVLAGALLGAAVWLRPNSLLLAVFLWASFLLKQRPFALAFWRGAVLTAACIIVVAPITVRNYVLYHRFVPVTINLGIVMWEGIGEARGGERFGAVKTDVEVGHQDAEIYHNPEYTFWASPDGIDRDHDRVRRSLSVIVRHPVWYLGVMLSRMRGMLNYAGQAPMVYKRSLGVAPQREGGTIAPVAQQARNVWLASDKRALIPGETLAFLRLPVRILQRFTKDTLPWVILIGMVAAFLLSPNRWILISVTPIYYLICQSAMHTEFRYSLPMHYFLFIFAGTGWILVARGAYSVWVRFTGHRVLKQTERT
ncbi:MAG TPA: glycosyltransferase family 39 protein, partial [Blastocatellia bacterium]|nr:glycosyltransferase family 39 protein [Blastocatellia bacterium]